MNLSLRILALIGACSFISLSHAGTERSEPCVDLSCLVCPDAAIADKYQGANMRMVRHLALGENQWLFRSVVDFENNFGMPRDMEPELKRLLDTFRAQGSEVLFAVQPTRGLMHRDKILPDHSYGFNYAQARQSLADYLEQLRRSGAHVPDILLLIDNPPSEEYFFRRDTHWTPAGARATAKVTADYLRHLPLYDALEKAQFQTEPGVTIVNYGVLDMALERLCMNKFGNQFVRGYRTIPITGDDEDALFGDQSEPEVVLVGTSNSAARDEEIRHYNFDGALKELAEVDLLNFAMQGAGQYGALTEYLHSSSYQPAQAPKLYIWELPANYRLDSPAMYRQLIPAIKGGCSLATTLKKQSSSLPAGSPGQRTEIFSNAGENRLELTGQDGFLQLNLSDKDLRDFYLISYYDNGARDKIRIRRPGVVTGGLYYLELSRDPNLRQANLLSVFIEPNDELAAEVKMDVQLCQ